MLPSDFAQVARALAEAVAADGVLGDATKFHLASGGKAEAAHLLSACNFPSEVKHHAA